MLGACGRFGAAAVWVRLAGFACGVPEERCQRGCTTGVAELVGSAARCRVLSTFNGRFASSDRDCGAVEGKRSVQFGRTR